VVRGASPTQSGLEILPLMAGLILTSTVGGQIVSRTGRYRIFPIVGTAFMTIGGFLLAQLTPTTSTVTAGIYMFITGFGIGLVMQVLVVAVQNAVRYEDLGVATSGTTLLRNTGSSIGTAIVGTIFATQLASRLAAAFPRSSAVVFNTSHPTTAELAKLPSAVRATVIQAYSSSLDRAFLVGAFISIIAFVASWLITELPMRTTVQSQAVEDEASDDPLDGPPPALPTTGALTGTR
jgi:MFS family permease